MELYHPDGPASRPTSVSNSSTAPPSDDDIEAVIQMATSARPSPAIAPSKDTRTQLFVGNLPYRVRWQDLKDLFRKAGTVLRADVSLGPDNRSRGYGTVLLATAEDAGRAIDMFNGYSWQTRILEVRPDRLPPADFDNPLGQAVVVPSPTPTKYLAYEEMNELNAMLQQQQHGHNSPHLNPPSNLSQSRNLFVGNLPFQCQWQDLKDLFRQAGTIIRADVAQGPDGRSRGFGTVVFANDYDAERAVNMFNGYEYHGRVLKVHYDKFSQLGHQLPLTAPPTGLNSPPLHSAQARPQLSSLSGGYSFDILGLAQDIQSPTPYDHANPVKHRPFSPDPSALRSPRVRPPQAHPLQQTTRSSSSSTSLSGESSSSSNPRSFDMESVATSLSSIGGGKFETAATVSLPAVPTTASLPQTGLRVKSQPPSPPRTATHPHHPGPISLPPPPPLTALPLSPGPLYLPGQSPLHHPYYQHLTPHGLPPITPSMPPFSFVPQPSPGIHPALYSQLRQQHAQPPFSHPHPPASSSGSSDSTATFGDEVSSTKASVGSSKGQKGPDGSRDNDQSQILDRSSFVGQMHPLPSPSIGFSMPLPTPPFYGPFPLPTPPLHPHVTAAAQHFSPMSPGAFWGGGAINPFINPAVGAPVRRGFMGTPGDIVTGRNTASIPNAAPGSEKDKFSGQPLQPSGYFDIGLGYFPPVTTSETSGVTDEIMKPKSVPTAMEDPDSVVGADLEKGEKEPPHANSRAYSASGVERPAKLTRSGGSDPATVTFASIARGRLGESTANKAHGPTA